MTNMSSRHSDQVNADYKKFSDMIKDIRIAMLTTVDEQSTLRSRPMATQDVEFVGDLWFFTARETGKVNDITHYPQVNVAYASEKDERYVSVMGNADLVDDRQKMKDLWKPIMKAWFPEGLGDPNLQLIKVHVEKVEYWESNGGKIGSLLGIVKNLVTGTTGAEGTNKEITLDQSADTPQENTTVLTATSAVRQ